MHIPVIKHVLSVSHAHTLVNMQTDTNTCTHIVALVNLLLNNRTRVTLRTSGELVFESHSGKEKNLYTKKKIEGS